MSSAIGTVHSADLNSHQTDSPRLRDLVYALAAFHHYTQASKLHGASPVPLQRVVQPILQSAMGLFRPGCMYICRTGISAKEPGLPKTRFS